MPADSIILEKPLLRGHFHQAAFFVALGACAMLLGRVRNSQELIAILIYSFSLVTLLGTSALYHRRQWEGHGRVWMKRLDHAAIFILIAGTSTPICLLAGMGRSGSDLLLLIWSAASIGIVQSLLWVRAPKWLSVILYISLGWLCAPYVDQFRRAMGPNTALLLLVGGVVYTVGAFVYLFRWPNPSPKYFGYHEIFHIMVILAAALHFIGINRLISA